MKITKETLVPALKEAALFASKGGPSTMRQCLIDGPSGRVLATNGEDSLLAGINVTEYRQPEPARLPTDEFSAYKAELVELTVDQLKSLVHPATQATKKLELVAAAMDQFEDAWKRQNPGYPGERIMAYPKELLKIINTLPDGEIGLIAQPNELSPNTTIKIGGQFDELVGDDPLSFPYVPEVDPAEWISADGSLDVGILKGMFLPTNTPDSFRGCMVFDHEFSGIYTCDGNQLAVTSMPINVAHHLAVNSAAIQRMSVAGAKFGVSSGAEWIIADGHLESGSPVRYILKNMSDVYSFPNPAMVIRKVETLPFWADVQAADIKKICQKSALINPNGEVSLEFYPSKVVHAWAESVAGQYGEEINAKMVGGLEKPSGFGIRGVNVARAVRRIPEDLIHIRFGTPDDPVKIEAVDGGKFFTVIMPTRDFESRAPAAAAKAAA